MTRIFLGQVFPVSESYALFTSASKSFNIPALTGAYGIINDSRSRYAFHGCCTKNYQSAPSLVP